MDGHEGAHIFTSPNDQSEAIANARHTCLMSGAYDAFADTNETMYNNISDITGDMCTSVWDGILCWPATAVGQLRTQSCPAYIAGFDHQAEATRFCTSEGQWFINAKHNKTWSNYSMCYPEGGVLPTIVVRLPDVINGSHTTNTFRQVMPMLKLMSQLGHSVSLISLIVAFCILATTKKLRCPRNTLHMHLFVSFILRAFMALLKDTLFVQGVGLPSDVVVKNGQSYFSQQEHNWACKSVTSVWQFCIMANYSWILMEGLYLHNLIFLALFTDSSAITLYVILGWGLPVLVVVPWVILRVAFEDTFCWTTHQSRLLSLVMRIPISLSIVINFVFFVNIVRVLFLKLRSSISEETRRYRYRKWARSTLVLVPLFGVHYTLFLALELSIGTSQTVEILWLFGDQFLASFQGFCVAVLYCFLNGEVRSELGKKWRHRRWKVSNRGSCSDTAATKGTRRASNGLTGSLAKLCRWTPTTYAMSSCTSVEPACAPLCNVSVHQVQDCNCRTNAVTACGCHTACQGLLQRVSANEEIHLEMKSLPPRE